VKTSVYCENCIFSTDIRNTEKDCCWNWNGTYFVSAEAVSVCHCVRIWCLCKINLPSYCSAQDGTVNVHTIQEGQYVRTLEPVGCERLKTEITFLTLSSQGHIAFSATDKVWWSPPPSPVGLINLIYAYLLCSLGAHCSIAVKALCYKPEGCEFDSRLNLPNPSGRTRPWGLLSL
jgi:hypothetical protein